MTHREVIEALTHAIREDEEYHEHVSARFNKHRGSGIIHVVRHLKREGRRSRVTRIFRKKK